MASTSVRPEAPTASRRSISSQAASASRALTSAASTSVSSPYAGLPSSASSSSSLSTPKRRSLAAAGRNSFSRYSASSSSTGSLVNDGAASSQGRRSVSAASITTDNIDEEFEPIASTSRTADANAYNSAQAAAAARAAKRSPRHQRHHSAESLRLDLDGLDLGGNQEYVSPFDGASTQRHLRSRSNNATQPIFKEPFADPSYNGVHVDMDRFCASCADEGRTHEALNGLEDSFSLHLRAECSDYREIMSSQVVINAAVAKEQRMRNASLETVDPHRPRGYSISQGQVLGGFASLGLQTETEHEPPAPLRQQPVRTITKGSTDSSEAPVTPIEWRDSFGIGSLAVEPTYTPPPKWAHLTSRPCNPLEPLDVLSIQEMGFHSLDIGSLNDWEGCKLSAEILCPINGHQRIEWSVAQTTRRNKKWVVVPNATVTCGTAESLSSAAQAERTVIVSHRSLWLDESDTGVGSLAPRDAAQSASMSQSLQKQPTSNRSLMPFSGTAGFELRLLRPTVGKVYPPVYLANASTHRFLYQYRKEHGSRSSQSHGASIKDAASDRSSIKASQPVYPMLRRSRSRPYLRHPHAPLRRSRSKPYLRYSAQQQAAGLVSPNVNPEEFAPSLPGDPLVRMHPGESWPSARSRHTDSLSSFDSASSSDVGSDTSSDDAGLSATNTRESVVGSMSSASYDQPASKGNGLNESERARSTAIPMAVTGARSGRVPRSLSPGSSASRGLSSTSETSAALAGWQHGSLEQQRYHQQYPGSASYEADSWQGTSPTTASASSLSASSKQSRSRKGFQKALQKKDKMLNSWFKRRPDNAAGSTSVSPGTEREMASQSTSSMSQQGQVSASSSTRSSLARESQDGSVAGAVTGSTPLTETALESFQRSMFRPASPESTIMGSRRGSEALTQKTVEPSGPTSTAGQVSQERTAATDNRSAVHSTLSQVYGWDEEQATSKQLRPVADTSNGRAHSSFQDLDEQNALLGLEAVPSGALTMLIPLPLIGRARAQDAVRYMRVNFVPFGSFADPFEASSGPSAGALLNAASPGSESDAGLSQSISTGSGSFASHREAAKTSEQSSWKRKLGLSGGRGGNGAHVSAGQTSGANGSGQSGASDLPQSLSPAASKPEAFRITAVVHDAPWTTSASSELDPRLPEPGTFPVVLGYCNGSKGLEMVPEGWGALRLAGVPVPTKPDGSPLDGVHPLHGVTDLIIAACTAVMDV